MLVLSSLLLDEYNDDAEDDDKDDNSDTGSTVDGDRDKGIVRLRRLPCFDIIAEWNGR
jgi:hypothetical protein